MNQEVGLPSQAHVRTVKARVQFRMSFTEVESHCEDDLADFARGFDEFRGIVWVKLLAFAADSKLNRLGFSGKILRANWHDQIEVITPGSVLVARPSFVRRQLHGKLYSAES